MTGYRVISPKQAEFTDPNWMMDIMNPETVNIQRSHTGEYIWINIDGICRIRVRNPGHVLIEDLSGKLEINRIDD